MYWPRAGHFKVAANLFQAPGPKIATFWEEKLPWQCQRAGVAESVGKGHVPSAEGFPCQCSGSHAGGPRGMGTAWQSWLQWPGLHFAGGRF